MKSLVKLQTKLVPDLLKVMRQRYYILQSVYSFEPIGRRALAEKLNATERQVRSEIDFLHQQGLLEVTSKGMYLSKEGKLLLEQMAEFMREITGLSMLEERIREKLKVEEVVIVPGDSDTYEQVKREMGKACVTILKKVVKKPSTIAVTGGTTMAAVAEVMSPLQQKCLFVPARGGVGEKVENQANGIAAQMAQKAKGDYRLLYVPDPLSETAYHSLVHEPSIQNTLEQLKTANIVIHGIGDALTLAKRRNTDAETVERLVSEKAMGEAFGYYFDEDGNIVHKVRTLGIHLEDLETMDAVISVAGGRSKAKAITSFLKQRKTNVLITDEGAAKEILQLE
ncbi:central glycolytic genes regulator [Compostibacillus humi]|uniref:Central glycolytic genes regulator n=1 Tax=Compostibacillus humi TaxID=1245525 RepID=A0A8J2XGV3_9BACI|nr:sugar-binding domain-containing protein [Compostibacillus humi]GFZ85504.1 central glycolytic genes regulator [Compostibacillus humi]